MTVKFRSFGVFPAYLALPYFFCYPVMVEILYCLYFSRKQRDSVLFIYKQRDNMLFCSSVVNGGMNFFCTFPVNGEIVYCMRLVEREMFRLQFVPHRESCLH
jgi:hypothetical protein